MELKSKVIPTSFLKIEERGTFVEAKKGRLVELVCDQNPGPEAPPRKGNMRFESEVGAGVLH